MVPLFRLSGWSFVAAMVAFLAFVVVFAIEPDIGSVILSIMICCSISSFFFFWGALIAALSPPNRGPLEARQVGH